MMYPILAAFTRFLPRNLTATGPSAATPADDHAHRLMESAQASAGLDARQAAELRRAATAYLRVVR